MFDIFFSTAILSLLTQKKKEKKRKMKCDTLIFSLHPRSGTTALCHLASACSPQAIQGLAENLVCEAPAVMEPLWSNGIHLGALRLPLAVKRKRYSLLQMVFSPLRKAVCAVSQESMAGRKGCRYQNATEQLAENDNGASNITQQREDEMKRGKEVDIQSQLGWPGERLTCEHT